MCPSPDQPVMSIEFIIVIISAIIICYLAWRAVNSKGDKKMRILKLSEAKEIDADFIYKNQNQYIAIITEKEKNDNL